MSADINELRQLQKRIVAYESAMSYLDMDMQSIAPRAACESISRIVGQLTVELKRVICAPDVHALIGRLEVNRSALDERTLRELDIIKKRTERESRADECLMCELVSARSEGVAAWQRARERNDFSPLAPYLSRNIELKRRLHEVYDPKGELECYDFWLNEYAPGSSTSRYDAYFALLKRELMPLVKRAGQNPVDMSCLGGVFPVDKQKELARWVLGLILPYEDRWYIGETVHPFGGGTGNRDIRIYTRYDERHITGALFSMLHEGGHGIHAMLQPDWANDSLLREPSCDVAESQSRFQENIIGRSREFISFVYPKLSELFPKQFQKVSAEDFYRAANAVTPCLLRSESGEVIYLFQIMIRYEIEKQLFSGELAAEDIPRAWAEKFHDYMGIEVTDDLSGCLQDIHWAFGSFGYFPAYALGGAYGAQLLAKMERDIPCLWQSVAKGDLSGEVAWLGEKLYSKCNIKPMDEALADITGAGFDPSYYVDYLKDKIKSVYILE